MLRSEPDAHLLLLGGGPYESYIREKVNEYGIASRTRMKTGYVSREDIVQGLREADMFMFASQTETQGLVLGEAMSCGIPVVVVDADATREFVDSGREGFIVPDADGPFAEAVVSLIRDEARRKAMGQLARNRVEQISAARCTERLVDVYNSVLERHAHSLAI